MWLARYQYGNGWRASQRILVAEDNPVNQRMVAAVLRRAGWQYAIFENGLHAVEQLTSETSDLVLMDCQMPIMDGLEATRRIRALSSEKRNVPIVALTANAFDSDREACIAAGMNDFIPKPFDAVMLVATLDQWIMGSNQLPSASR